MYSLLNAPISVRMLPVPVHEAMQRSVDYGVPDHQRAVMDTVLEGQDVLKVGGVRPAVVIILKGACTWRAGRYGWWRLWTAKQCIVGRLTCLHYLWV